MRAERKRANAASHCAYPQMVTGFYQWSCLTEAKGTHHSHFVSTLSEVRSLLIAFSFDDGWLSWLNYVPLSTCMAGSAFC